MKRHVPPTVSRLCFVLASRSLLDVSVIHPSKAAAAYRAIDTIDRLWSHERSNLGYGILTLYRNSFLESYVYAANPGLLRPSCRSRKRTLSKDR